MVEERGRRASGRVRAGVRRVLVLIALVAAGVMTGRLVALLLDDAAPAAAPSARPPAAEAPARPSHAGSEPDPEVRGSARRATSVLHGWDADRATAYARGDPSALRRLYVRGSRAGVRDLRVLRAYADRGLVVHGLRTQLLSLRVLTSAPDHLVVEVVDRLVGGRAAPRSGARGAGVLLPADAPSTRRVVLVRRAGEWRVSSVRAA